MADYFYNAEDDISMNEDLDFDPLSATHDSADSDEDAPVDLPALHTETTTLLAVKSEAIADFVPMPKIQTIYFHQIRALVPTVPADLQLAFFFAIYNDIASASFVALKSAAQHMDISRAIWYYGNDAGHSFSRRWNQVRYNIVLMAFVWASGFDERCCAPGCEQFVKAYLMVSHSHYVPGW